MDLQPVDNVAGRFPVREARLVDVTVARVCIVAQDDVVCTGPAIERVALEIAQECAGALLAVEQVLVLAAVHPVVVGPAEEDVGPHVAVHPVVTGASLQHVVTLAQVGGAGPGFDRGPGTGVLAAEDGVTVVSCGVAARSMLVRRIVPVRPVRPVAHQRVVAVSTLDVTGAETAGEQVVEGVVDHGRERVVAGGAASDARGVGWNSWPVPVRTGGGFPGGPRTACTAAMSSGVSASRPGPKRRAA